MTALTGSVPDIEAGKRVPITNVADKLGIERCGNMLRCWRAENHQHGDRTPSVGIERRKNRVKCFQCDERRLSPVDLVQSVLRLDTFAALNWLDQQFGPLPRIPKGKHLVSRSLSQWRGPVGLGCRLESVIRSGLLSELSNCEVRLLFVLDAFCSSETNKCTISYAALRRYGGISKDSAISKALAGLKRIHAIEIERGLGGRGLAQCSTYTLTLEHSDFLSLLQSCCSMTRYEVEIERAIRAERRKIRSKNQENTKTTTRAQNSRPVVPSSRAEYITGILLSPKNGSRSQIPTPLEVRGRLVRDGKVGALDAPFNAPIARGGAFEREIARTIAANQLGFTAVSQAHETEAR